MTTVIGVRFKKSGKVYYFDPSDVWPKPGDTVVVETSRGIELGEVVAGAREIEDDQLVAPLKKVIRVASQEDVHRDEYNKSREHEAYQICQDKIAQHKLEMKLVEVEYTFDASKIIFYFTANGRIDFRELVKDLASVFKMRIELRQIGVRDEAKMLGGLGSCGRPICCGAFLGDFQPVSIKMAKEQNLSLNPTKISGQCGRLMCCLKYEQDYYEAAHKRLPRLGREGMTPDGPGIVTDINVIREKVKVRVRNPDDTYDVREYDMMDVSKSVRGPEGEAAPAPKPVDTQAANKPRKPRPPRDESADTKEQDRPVKERPPRPEGDARRDRPQGDRPRQDHPQGDRPRGDRPAEEASSRPPRRRSSRGKGSKQPHGEPRADRANPDAPKHGAPPPQRPEAPRVPETPGVE